MTRSPLSVWDQLGVYSNPFQTLHWYRSSGVLEETTLLSIRDERSGLGEWSDSIGCSMIPVRPVRQHDNYYHDPRQVVFGHLEHSLFAQHGLSQETLLEVPWGKTLISISPFGYRGGILHSPGVSERELKELAYKLLRHGRDVGASVVFLHYLFNDGDSDWIEALVSAGAKLVVIGAHSRMAIPWNSMDDYFYDLRSRRTIRSRKAWGTVESNVNWDIFEESIPEHTREHCISLFANFAKLHGNVVPPTELYRTLHNDPNFSRVLLTARTGESDPRSALLVLKSGQTLYAKFFGTNIDMRDYFPIVYNRLIQYAVENGYKLVDYGGGAHQAKLLRGCTLHLAVGAYFLLDQAFAAQMTPALRIASRAKKAYFEELSERWHLHHTKPICPDLFESNESNHSRISELLP